MRTRRIIIVFLFIALTLGTSYLFFIEESISYSYSEDTEIRKTELLNKSPYSMFGDSSVMLMTTHERKINHTLEIYNSTPSNSISKFVLNSKTGVIHLINNNNEIVSEIQLQTGQFARFMTTDRFAEKYYHMSPYQYGANNPICNIDINGDSIKVRIYENNNYLDLVYNNGQLYNNGQVYEGNNQFATSTLDAINTLAAGDVGELLVGFLASNENILTINQGFRIGDNKASEDGTQILWNHKQSDDGAGNSRPSFVALGHEMAHIQDNWKGSIDLSEWYSFKDDQGRTHTRTKSEIYATHMENQIRTEHGLPLRQFDTPGLNDSRIITNHIERRGVVQQRGGLGIYYNNYDYRYAHSRRNFFKGL